MNRSSIRCAYGALTLLFMVDSLHASTPQAPGAVEWAVPNLFDTVALPVAKSPYDTKWRKAWAGGRGPSARFDQHRTVMAEFSALATVQRDINHRISYRPDMRESGSVDNWATAAKTLARRFGDCEDFAITKAQQLLSLGFRPDDLYLVIGRIHNSDHAILVVRSGGKFWVLDNLSDAVVDAAKVSNFEPVMTLSANRKWLHGYDSEARKRAASFSSAQMRRPSTTMLSAVKIAQSTIRTR